MFMVYVEDEKVLMEFYKTKIKSYVNQIMHVINENDTLVFVPYLSHVLFIRLHVIHSIL